MSKHIVVYSAQLCSDCQYLKAFLDKEGVAYENRDIRENREHGTELKRRTGKLGVPYVVIDGEWKRGYQPGQPFSENFARNLLGMA